MRSMWVLRRREEGVVVGMAMLGEGVLVMGKDGSGGFGGFGAQGRGAILGCGLRQGRGCEVKMSFMWTGSCGWKAAVQIYHFDLRGRTRPLGVLDVDRDCEMVADDDIGKPN